MSAKKNTTRKIRPPSQEEVERYCLPRPPAKSTPCHPKYRTRYRYQHDPKLPWNQKAPSAVHSDSIKLVSLREELRHLELPSNARSIDLAYLYKEKASTGIYALDDRTSGIELEVELEAGSLRHFQVQMIQGILGNIAPVGDVVVYSDELSLVEHFNPMRWNYYRSNDWKEPSGDKFHFRILYQEIDESMEGRVVVVTFPEPNGTQVEKLTQRIKAISNH